MQKEKLKSKDTCVFLPSCHVDVGNEAKHPYNVRAGDNEAFLSAVEEVARNRVLDSRCGMGTFTYGIHDRVSPIVADVSSGEEEESLCLYYPKQILAVEGSVHKSRSREG